jgi:hypothetical protein
MLTAMIFVITLVGCVAPKAADSCSGVNSASAAPSDASRKPGKKIFHRKGNSEVKGEDGYRRKNRKYKTYGEKAEKGKKTEKDTKAKKRWRLLKKKSDGAKDADRQDKGVFRSNEKRLKKDRKKKSKRPEMGLWGKKGPKR